MSIENMRNTHAPEIDVDGRPGVTSEQFEEALIESINSRNNGPELPPIELTPEQKREEANKAIKRRDELHALHLKKQEAEIKKQEAETHRIYSESQDKQSIADDNKSISDNSKISKNIGNALSIATIVLAGFGLLLGVSSLKGPRN